MTLRFTGPTWTSTHQYGEGEKNTQRKLVYYHIPKCASVWMRKYITELSCTTGERWLPTYFTEEPLDDYTKIIILRDPIARWISVCPAENKIQSIEPLSVECDTLFNNLDKFLLDEHLALQINFIQGLDLSNAIWFKTDSDLSKNMQHFIITHITDQVPAPPPMNLSNTGSNRQNAVRYWQALLEIPKYKQKLQQLYQRDYDLIDSIEFYEND